MFDFVNVDNTLDLCFLSLVACVCITLEILLLYHYSSLCEKSFAISMKASNQP